MPAQPNLLTAARQAFVKNGSSGLLAANCRSLSGHCSISIRLHPLHVQYGLVRVDRTSEFGLDHFSI